MASDQERQKAMAAVEDMLELYRYIAKKTDFRGYDLHFFETVRLIDASVSGLVWELDVTPFWGNLNEKASVLWEVMHGGAMGTVFDMCMAAAMCPISRPGYWEFIGGVTRSLNISYARAIPLHTTIRIVCTLIQHGRTTALVQARMESVDGKVVYATAECHRVHTPMPVTTVRFREEMRREKEIEKKRQQGDNVKGEVKSKL